MGPLQPCALHRAGFSISWDDIETLKDGFRLMIAMCMVGRLMKWMSVAVTGSMFEEGMGLLNSG
jgi:hypothetical protein